MPSRPRPVRFFFLRHLVRWGLAEGVCQLGNLLPGTLSQRLWRLTLWLNGHHEVAAINLATTLTASMTVEDSGAAWRAFERCLRQLENRHEISASDLYLSRWPSRLARQLAARWLWGTIGASRPLDAVHDGHDKVLQGALARLARRHVGLALERGSLERARRAFEVWRSLVGDTVESQWVGMELRWASEPDVEIAAYKTLQDLLHRGVFVSPLDCLRWGQRFLDRHHLPEARRCFEHARRLLPEEAATWRGAAQVAMHDEDHNTAQRFWRRALARQPQDVTSWLALHALEMDRPNPSPVMATEELRMESVRAQEIDAEFDVTARLHDVDAPSNFTLHLLPPVGCGLVVPPQPAPFNAEGRATVQVIARRPHRVLGRAWPLVALAVGPAGHLRTELRVEVFESSPGEVLLAVTEDHEIHEERGLLSPELLHKVLVDKSAAAADLGVPWTHMVEVGSVLAMPSWAAAHGDTWRQLWVAVRRHLVDEVARGNDLQPHLHTFNDPAYDHFPYRLEDAGWRPSMPFLLTEAQRRGDFATACPPPGHPAEEGEGWDRLQSVERTVALLESVGRLGSADYRPLLWRSGLLEYGESAADQAWSAVALRRAGLVADSDVLQTTTAVHAPRAVVVGWSNPATEDPLGPLVQLPIVSNLEGSYVQGRRQLTGLVRRCLEALSGRPGIHLLTLLTHDKFINARRGRNEHELDPGYGDWPVIQSHLAAWREAGAQVVTAAEGVRRVLDDTGLHLQAVLRQETFFVMPSGSSAESLVRRRIRYRIDWLGRAVEPSEQVPQQVWVPLPCSWRGQIEGVDVQQGHRVLEVSDADAYGFWVEVTSLGEPVYVTLDLASTDEGSSQWPRLEVLGTDQDGIDEDGIDEDGVFEDGAFEDTVRHLRWTSAQPFRDARVLIPWHAGFSRKGTMGCRPLPTSHGKEVTGAAVPPVCTVTDDGLLITGLAFHEDDVGNVAPAEWLLVENP